MGILLVERGGNEYTAKLAAKYKVGIEVQRFCNQVNVESNALIEEAAYGLLKERAERC